MQQARTHFKVRNLQCLISFRSRQVSHTLLAITSLTPYREYKLEVEFTTPKLMRELNLQTRNKDSPTDVISIPFEKALSRGRLPKLITPELAHLGWIYVCPEYALNSLGKDTPMPVFAQHLRTLFIHSVCHLMGYDHETDADYAIMQALEEDLAVKYQAAYGHMPLDLTLHPEHFTQ